MQPPTPTRSRPWMNHTSRVHWLGSIVGISLILGLVGFGLTGFWPTRASGQLTTHVSPHSPQAVVLIDAMVPHPEFFLQQLTPDQSAIVIQPDQDLAAVTRDLQQFHHLAAIHVITHGAPGQLTLGQTRLALEPTPTALIATSDGTALNSAQSLESQFRQWGKVLAPGGDVLLYGCEVGATPIGMAFLRQLQNWTQADIAASSDRTGSPDHQANWDLEVQLGQVTTALALHGNYPTTLGQFTVTHSGDRGEGSLRWAINQANATREDDLIKIQPLTEVIALNSPLPTIHSNVYVQGQGAIVSGGEQVRVFSVQDGNLAIQDLTIADGLARGTNGMGAAGGSAGLGGGLWIDRSRVMLSRVKLVNNRAEGGNGGQRLQPTSLDQAARDRPNHLIETEKIRAKVNRGALANIMGISSPGGRPHRMAPDSAPESLNPDPITPEIPSTLSDLSIHNTDARLNANRGAIAGVQGIGVNGIGSIAFGGGGGFGGFGNAGNGGNGGNGGAEGGNGGNGGDGGNGGVGIFGSFGQWEDQGSIGTIAYGGGGGFGGFGNAGNGGNGGNPGAAIATGGNGGNGGNGGFGGGGGGGGYGGQGGQAGGAGEPQPPGESGHPGQGGYGGGAGELGYGGGGAGFGGAIFLKSGQLILHDTEFDQNLAIAGQGAHPGQGKGHSIFIWPGLPDAPDAATALPPASPNSSPSSSELTASNLRIFSLGAAPRLTPAHPPLASEAPESLDPVEPLDPVELRERDAAEIVGSLVVLGDRR